MWRGKVVGYEEEDQNNMKTKKQMMPVERERRRGRLTPRWIGGEGGKQYMTTYATNAHRDENSSSFPFLSLPRPHTTERGIVLVLAIRRDRFHSASRSLGYPCRPDLLGFNPRTSGTGKLDNWMLGGRRHLCGTYCAVTYSLFSLSS